MSDSLFVFVKLCSLDCKSVCVLFAICLPCVNQRNCILEPDREFVSCSFKCSYFWFFIHTAFNAITLLTMSVNKWTNKRTNKRAKQNKQLHKKAQQQQQQQQQQQYPKSVRRCAHVRGKKLVQRPCTGIVLSSTHSSSTVSSTALTMTQRCFGLFGSLCFVFFFHNWSANWNAVCAPLQYHALVQSWRLV